jgi:hypothetical protein
MPYAIQKTNGTAITVEDGSTNTSSTSLTLVGKNYPGYGVFLNQNFVRLLENFSNTSSPDDPLSGQLWWDSTNKLLKVYQGTGWKVISSSMSSSTAPADAVVGDLWWDTTNSQLKVYPGGIGASWVTIGPAFTTATGQTGAIADIITDNTAGAIAHSVIKFFVDNDLVGILSQDAEFTPASLLSAPGFSIIKPGFNFSSLVAGVKYHGTATDADAVGGVAAANLARIGSTNLFTASQAIRNNSGLQIGTSNDLSLTVSSGAVNINSAVAGNDLVMSITGTAAMRVKSTGYVEVEQATPVSNKGIASKQYVDAQIAALNAASGGDLATAIAGLVKRDGTASITGTLVPDANNTRNIGTSSLKFNTIYATTFAGQSSTALYADLAERFESDSAYQPGTVVEIGGPAEITKVGQDLSENVFGVISTRAAYLMNAGVGTDATHPAVAISGRVPVRVVGKVKKGDRLVSAGNGLARAGSREEITAWNVIGRSLTNKETEGEGTVEAIVKLNS